MDWFLVFFDTYMCEILSSSLSCSGILYLIPICDAIFSLSNSRTVVFVIMSVISSRDNLINPLVKLVSSLENCFKCLFCLIIMCAFTQKFHQAVMVTLS